MGPPASPTPSSPPQELGRPRAAGSTGSAGRRQQEYFADTLAQAMARYMPNNQPRIEPERVARIKLPTPGTFDGKPKTPFRPWWKTIRHYFRFYPPTTDEQRIAFVGALLTDEAKAWHHDRDDLITEDPRRRDNWVAYSEAIIAEYTDPHEATTAHEQLQNLKYKGDIKAYITAFKTLNRVAGSNGEGLQSIINRALPHDIIDVRFFQNPRPLTTDQDFIQACYEAGKHVEALKALKNQTTATPNPKPKDTKKTEKTPRRETGQEAKTEVREGKKFGDNRCWPSNGAAFAGVPEEEINDHKKGKKDCIRCGLSGHTVHSCFANATIAGTKLTPAPWKSAATSQKKRAREDDEKPPAPKQQKIAAVETMEVEPVKPCGDSDSEDF
jgi:hypothetical protein